MKSIFLMFGIIGALAMSATKVSEKATSPPGVGSPTPDYFGTTARCNNTSIIQVAVVATNETERYFLEKSKPAHNYAVIQRGWMINNSTRIKQQNLGSYEESLDASSSRHLAELYLG